MNMTLNSTFGIRCRAGVALATATVLSGCVPFSRDGARRPVDSTLAAAWRFAEAIVNDPADRALCMERVAREHLRRGDFDGAIERARAIEGWRRSSTLADIATDLFQAGETASARRILADARAAADTVTDWPRDRVRLHLAQADALAENLDSVASVRVSYDGDAEYRGRAKAYLALAQALWGSVEEAEATLESIPEVHRYEDFAWRSDGYLLLASRGRLPPETAAGLLDKAWTTAEEIPGWKAWETRLDVVDAMSAGDLRAARLDEAVESVRALRLPAHLQAPLLARVALSSGRMGRMDEVRALAGEAAAMVDTGIQSIEQPALWAAFAEAAALAGGRAEAAEWFGRAIDVALTLVNLRPRAMAAVEIALAAARCGFGDEPVPAGLTRLLATFHDG